MKISFNREEYLSVSSVFENETLDDIGSELSEFNEDVEDMAYELAYTRYALAKTERELAALRLVRSEKEAGRINEEWWANMVADRERLKAELAALKDRLDGAARSLETISKQAGRDEYMETMTEVRAYAANRAMVASGEFERLRGEG